MKQRQRERDKDKRSESEKREGKMTRGNDSRQRSRRVGEEGKKTDGGRKGDMHLFAEALTVLILNKEVKLIRFISNGCL